MRQRYRGLAVAVLAILPLAGPGVAQEQVPREGVRLPLLGAEREPIDLLSTPSAEVERRLQEQAQSQQLLFPLPGLSGSPLAEPSEGGASADAGEREQEAEAAAEVVEVAQAWVPASRRGEGVVQGGAAFKNTADRPHRLERVRTEAAEEAFLHTVDRQAGVRQAQRLRSLYLPPQEQVELRPGGAQLLLVDLRHPLSEGEAVTLELHFDDGSRKRVEAPVRAPSSGR
ncbi:MAG: copper chaperone PCu(A)C [Halorhodospira sp.]